MRAVAARFSWVVGVLGLLLVVIVSVHQLTTGQKGTAGIPAGDALRRFVAPLATSNLQGDANVQPHCDPAHPNPLALNACGRTKLALALVSLRSGACVREVDTLQTLSARFPHVRFAAVVVGSGRASVLQVARRHGWTIPVAFDPDGAVGQLYGVAVCPIVELADRMHITDRLVGERWLSTTLLAGRIQHLAAMR